MESPQNNLKTNKKPNAEVGFVEQTLAKLEIENSKICVI